MVENLKTTRLNDSTPIPNVTDNTEWAALTTQAYCWYGNDTANKSTYGALYNWYTVNTGKLAPIGWHVPSEAEWETLKNYLGGTDIAGGKLKESGTAHWESPNEGATNETGFTALPGGCRSGEGFFSSIIRIGLWWSVTETEFVGFAMCQFLDYSSISAISETMPIESGLTVRCVKD